MIEVRAALDGEAERLRELWRQGFGDSNAFIDLYNASMFRPENAQLLLVDGHVAAMTMMIPAQLRFAGGEMLAAHCIYALTSLPEYRGRGFGTGVLYSAMERMGQSGIPFTLISPDSESLFDLYRKCGFKDAFYVREAQMDVSDTSLIKPLLRPASSAEYTEARNHFLNGREYVVWDERATAFQKAICQSAGGDLYVVEKEDLLCCMAAEVSEDGELIVLELLALDDEWMLPCLTALALLFSVRSCLVRMPAFLGESLGGEIKHFGMIHRNGNDFGAIGINGYLGFDFC